MPLREEWIAPEPFTTLPCGTVVYHSYKDDKVGEMLWHSYQLMVGPDWCEFDIRELEFQLCVLPKVRTFCEQHPDRWYSLLLYEISMHCLRNGCTFEDFIVKGARYVAIHSTRSA